MNRNTVVSFVAAVAAVLVTMAGVACHTAGAPLPKGAAVTQPASVGTGPSGSCPMGFAQVDSQDYNCVAFVGWTQVPAFTPTIVWSYQLAPQDIGYFTQRTELSVPNPLDNTGNAILASHLGVTVLQDASTSLAPDAQAQTVDTTQIGGGFYTADAAAVATAVLKAVGTTIELVVTSPVTGVAQSRIEWTRGALAPYVLSISPALGFNAPPNPVTLTVTTTTGATGGVTGGSLGGAGMTCVQASATTATCTLPAGSYAADAGGVNVCLTSPETPFCELNGYVFSNDASAG